MRFFYAQSQKIVLLQKQYAFLFATLDKVIARYDHELATSTDCVALYEQLIEGFKYEKEIIQKVQMAAHQKVIKLQSIKTVAKQDLEFIWPITKNKFWISSYFGPRKKPNGSWGFHHGIDMASVKGTKIKAAADGMVLEARIASGYGKTILLKHSDKLRTRYAHLDKILVQKGQEIKQKEIIGHVGETGLIRKTSEDGSHLHFEVYEQGHKVNPLAFLPHKKHA